MAWNAGPTSTLTRARGEARPAWLWPLGRRGQGIGVNAGPAIGVASTSARPHRDQRTIVRTTTYVGVDAYSGLTSTSRRRDRDRGQSSIVNCLSTPHRGDSTIAPRRSSSTTLIEGLDRAHLDARRRAPVDLLDIVDLKGIDSTRRQERRPTSRPMRRRRAGQGADRHLGRGVRVDRGRDRYAAGSGGRR